MATKGKILSYVDNVVSSYNSLEQEANFKNLEIQTTASIASLVAFDTTVTNQFRIGDTTNGYTFPSTKPSNPEGYYLSLNSAGNFEFKDFSTESLSTSDIAGIKLDGASDGDIVHFSNGNITTEQTSQITVIDNRPPLAGRFLANSDRMLISADAGVGTKLYRIEIKDLLQGLEFLQTSVSVIGSLTSNTKMAAGVDNFTYIIDKNNILTTVAEIDIDGFDINGNVKLTDQSILSFGNTTDAFIDTQLSEGYRISRNSNTVNFTFNGTRKLNITDVDLEVGPNLKLNNGANINLTSGGIVNSMAALLDVRANTIIDQNLRSSTTDLVKFYNFEATNSLRVGAATGAYRFLTNPTSTKLEIDAYDDNNQQTPIVSNTIINIVATEAATAAGAGALRVAGGLYAGSSSFITGDLTTSAGLTAGGNINSDLNITAGLTMQALDAVVANTSTLEAVTANTFTANSATLSTLTVDTDINVANSVFAIDFIQSSSLQYKENVKTFNNGLDYILNMKPVTYDRIDNNSKDNIGFIAEDMHKVLPSVVSLDGNRTGIKYTEIIPVLVSALKEQQNKISELESKINN